MNIRYPLYEGVYRILTIILSMNNPIGICFPDFIGSRPLDCLFAQGLGKENTGAERG